MAKIHEKFLTFDQADTETIKCFRVYAEPSEQDTLSYSKFYSCVEYPHNQIDTQIKLRLNLEQFETAISQWDIGVTSVDMAGNESDMVKLRGVTLDFFAPASPRGLRLLG